MVSSSKCAVPDWKSVTAWRMASTVDCAVGWCWDSRSLVSRSSPNMSPVALTASTMPSEKKTMRSPGRVERVNSSYSALGKRPRGKPSAWMVRTAGRLGGVVGVGGDEERLDGAGVGDLEGLVAVVPDGHEHGDVLGVELALLKLVVEGGEHGGG